MFRRNSASRRILFVPNETSIFVWDESDSMIGNLSSNYDTKCSIFSNHKIYKTIYTRFHFKITQDKKIAK
jgi:hypothetical protein